MSTDGQIDREMTYAAVEVAPSSVVSVRYAGLSKSARACGRNRIALSGCDATYNVREITTRAASRMRETDAASRGSSSTRKISSSTNAGCANATSAVARI